MNISATTQTANNSAAQTTAQAQAVSQDTEPRRTSGADQTVPEASRDRYIPGDATVLDRAQATEQERQQEQARDEFVPSPPIAHNALYMVSDIRSDQNGRIITPSQPNRIRGQQVSGKIVDIVLALGRKRLSIFRRDA